MIGNSYSLLVVVGFDSRGVKKVDALLLAKRLESLTLLRLFRLYSVKSFGCEYL